MRGGAGAASREMQAEKEAGGGWLTMDRKLTSPPIWMRPTLISTTVPRPLA